MPPKADEQAPKFSFCHLGGGKRWQTNPRSHLLRFFVPYLSARFTAPAPIRNGSTIRQWFVQFSRYIGAPLSCPLGTKRGGIPSKRPCRLSGIPRYFPIRGIAFRLPINQFSRYQHYDSTEIRPCQPPQSSIKSVFCSADMNRRPSSRLYGLRIACRRFHPYSRVVYVRRKARPTALLRPFTGISHQWTIFGAC